MKYDWKINSDIGNGRSRITYEDGTPVANMDALVDVEDYPKEWLAERIVAAHNGELRAAITNAGIQLDPDGNPYIHNEEKSEAAKDALGGTGN